MNSTPAVLHAATSVALIGREALLISVSARQNFWNPPPVPEIPTVGVRIFGFALPNSSATASAIGNTVLEPSTVIRAGCGAPACSPLWSGLPLPHAVIVAESTAAEQNRRQKCISSTLSKRNFAAVSGVLNPCYARLSPTTRRR